MTGCIFERWLRSWDRSLEKSGRQVVLLLDNCSAHTAVEGLKNFIVQFLPANTTSVLQPCDMGIIKTLKAYFRHEMRQKIIDIIDDAEVDLFAQEAAKWINMLEAMYMISRAWKKVSRDTIKNCWTKAGFAAVGDGLLDANQDPIFPPPPAAMTEDVFGKWLSVDDGAVVAPVMEEDKLNELIHGILHNEREKN